MVLGKFLVLPLLENNFEPLTSKPFLNLFERSYGMHVEPKVQATFVQGKIRLIRTTYFQLIIHIFLNNIISVHIWVVAHAPVHTKGHTLRVVFFLFMYH
jgi:hypothetical protein